MVIIGADLHKRTHTFVAVDEHGPAARRADRRRRRRHGHLELRSPGRRGSPSGAGRSRTAATSRRRLEARPARAPARRSCGCRPSSWPVPGARVGSPARATRSTRSRSPGRPSASPTCRSPGSTAPSGSVRLLVDHRDDLVAERTGAPEPAALAPPRARARRGARPADPRPAHVLEDRSRRALAGLDRARRPDRPRPRRPDPRADRPRSDRLEREIERLVGRPRPDPAAPCPGCGAAHRGQARRRDGGHRGASASTAAFARHNGTAPVPVWSGNERPPPPLPRRQPPAQRRAPPDRDHPDARPTDAAAPTSSAGGRPATPRPRRSGPSAAGSATRSTAGCASTRQPATRHHASRIDIGATGGSASAGGRPVARVGRGRPDTLAGLPVIQHGIARATTTRSSSSQTHIWAASLQGGRLPHPHVDTRRAARGGAPGPRLLPGCPSRGHVRRSRAGRGPI